MEDFDGTECTVVEDLMEQCTVMEDLMELQCTVMLNLTVH